MKEIRFSLDKDLKEDIVCRNCELIASCLKANFTIIDDDNSYKGLRFIRVKGDFNIIEKDNAVIIIDVQSLNNVLIHKDLIWEMIVRF